MSLRTWLRDWLNAPSKEELEATARANARTLEVFRAIIRGNKELTQLSVRCDPIPRLLEEEIPNSGYVAGGQVVGHPAESLASEIDAEPTTGEGSASE